MFVFNGKLHTYVYAGVEQIIMAKDSFQMIQEFHTHNIMDSCSCICDSLRMDHWYNFYKDQYTNLITTHSGLFGALIAAAVTIFCIKYVYEKISIDKKIDNKINEWSERWEKERRSWNKRADDDVSALLRSYRMKYISSELQHIERDDVSKIDSVIMEVMNILKSDSEPKAVDVGEIVQKVIGKLKELSNESLSNIPNARKFLTTINGKVSCSSGEVATETDSIGFWAIYVSPDDVKELLSKISSHPSEPMPRRDG